MSQWRTSGGPGVLHFFYPCVYQWVRYLVFGLFLTGCEADKPLNATEAQPLQETRPNILLVVVDDVGFSDLGFFGSEIPTPTLDSLATSGITFTNFHVAPTCSPTRSMLLSGVDSHQAGLGNMFEELAPNQKGQKGYEGYLHERVAPLPALFQDAGYQTFMSGKDQEGNVSRLAPTSTDDFAHGMGRGSDILETDGEYTKEEDLNGSSGGVPEGTGDTIVPGNVGGLEEGGGPGPLRDDN